MVLFLSVIKMVNLIKKQVDLVLPEIACSINKLINDSSANELLLIEMNHSSLACSTLAARDWQVLKLVAAFRKTIL